MNLNDILDNIPGNRAVFEDLVVWLRQRKAVAFVGAGASGGLYPMWNRFIADLADHAVAEGSVDRVTADGWKADTASTPQVRVDRIKAEIEEPRYRAFLKRTFGAKKGSDGRPYTPTHASLIRLPFRGYVTTNYDSGLDFARKDIRPATLSDGTPTWRDVDEVVRWRTGDVFSDGQDGCPILWLHGHWQKADSIVLNTAEYSEAYTPGLYQETFRELWVRERLIFVGFGFSDPQFEAMAGEFLKVLKGAHALPRHIALLSIAAEESRDFDKVKAARRRYEKEYHVRPLFFPTDQASGYQASTVLLAALEAATTGPGGANPSMHAVKLPRPSDGGEHTQPGVELRGTLVQTDLVIADMGLVLKPIPAGSFRMGNTGKYPDDVYSRGEKPIIAVTLTRAFWLGRTEVTQAQWRAVMGQANNPSHFKGDELPVESVSWDEAEWFCAKLTKRESAAGRLLAGVVYRLPTEAEWEYACRASTTGDFNDDSSCTVPEGKDPALDKLGWYGKNSGQKTHPVGRKLANKWGLHDMHGNVWEWCADR